MISLEVQILNIVTEIVLQKLAGEASARIGLAEDVQSLRVQLNNTVSTIKNLLDAETQSSQGYRPMGCLGVQLTEALYDADDVLDEFHYRSLKHKVEGKLRSALSAVVQPAFLHRTGLKMSKIKSTLDDIATNWTRFFPPEARPGVDVGVVPRRETHSNVDPSVVIGREHETQVVIGSLGISTETLSVLPIVGIEGIGKTTLAKLVYNDEWVKSHFPLRMWVYVSKDFDVKRLMKRIINSAEGGDCGDISMEEYQIRLKNMLRKKKRFLLVLDDVWNEDRREWLILESLLREGEVGSKIIVTTQSRSAAAVMGTVPMHELGPLSTEHSVALFTRLAFNDRLRERPPNLQKIGEEIVERCGGVPGLLKNNACWLYSNTEQRSWISRRDDLLKLSLDGLPSDLRQCLALSSIFPTNFRFYSLQLIQLWMALDFINRSHSDEDLEDAGNEYMNTLHSRCVIQSREPDYGDFSYVQIHNLTHDHAREAARPVYTLLNFGAPPEQSSTVRHVSLSENEWPEAQRVVSVLDALGKANKLRTILCPFVGGREMNELFIKAFIKRFKYVRVLDLSYSCFERLPKSIRDLIHLRLLSLRGNDRIRRLPNSLCELYSLQTLVLLGCIQLKQLPRDTGKMISLRHLEITTKQTNFPKLADSSCLRFLGIVGCMELRSLFREGQSFPALRTLLIDRCGSLKTLLPSIRHLSALRTLKIADCEKLDLWDGDDDTFPGFETLWHLVIVNSPRLEIMPRWILRTAASNYLQHIVIEACRNFRGLPQVVQQNPTMHQKFEIRN